jgi:hypothetical protein
MEIYEPAKSIPVIDEVDICVLGGSCTGVFAAVRAARLGAKVAIVEKQNCFGGVATAGLVNIWHSLYDTEQRQQIIGGLTEEVIERLQKRAAVYKTPNSPDSAYRLNTEELKIELDNLILESKVKAYLHTYYVSPYVENGELKAVIIENKSGRQAIKAKVFIDATGDGDLCYQLGLDYYQPKHVQPPTTCAKIYRCEKTRGLDFQKAISQYGKEFGLREDWGWNTFIPGLPNISFHAETHVFDVNCVDANQFTYSEMEGRRQVRAFMDLIRKYGPNESAIGLVDLPASIGIRETRHIKSQHKLTEADILHGRRFADAIANGSYRVDIHHSDCSGITFRYLDGTEEIISHRASGKSLGRWREELQEDPTFYQVPYRSIVPTDKFNNVLMCGRMIDADPGAFGAVRVMVNLNQLGEAAGVAAYLALDRCVSVGDVPIALLRENLERGGSIIL